MAEIVNQVILPDITVYLLGVLGLLIVWQYYHIQMLSGRIYAVDFWDISGIRMLLHVTTQDGDACRSCCEADGTVFLPSAATKKGFSTLAHPCTSLGGCRCLTVGLYAGWPEGTAIIRKLRKQSRKKPIKLNEEELLALFEGPWQRSISAASDRLTIHMLEAMRRSYADIEEAVVRYRYIIEHARGARDLRLVVPAYLHLSDALATLSRTQEALEVIYGFERRFKRKKLIFYFPNEAQRGIMSVRKARLIAQKTMRQPTRIAS